jgi:DNA-nicking Smr family endonuclease
MNITAWVPYMPKKTRIKEEDIAAFHEAVKGTRPIKQNKIRLRKTLDIKERSSHTRAPSSPETKISLSGAHDVPLVTSEAFISFKQTSLSYKTLRKLRKGQYNVEASLDLHGMTVLNAKETLEDFLQKCVLEGIRVILIIHGKGHHGRGPILKNKLNQWLREVNCVLAFCSATTVHGSRGAIYALLKSESRGSELE